jgi:hypothetical protein
MRSAFIVAGSSTSHGGTTRPPYLGATIERIQAPSRRKPAATSSIDDNNMDWAPATASTGLCNGREPCTRKADWAPSHTERASGTGSTGVRIGGEPSTDNVDWVASTKQRPPPTSITGVRIGGEPDTDSVDWQTFDLDCRPSQRQCETFTAQGITSAVEDRTVAVGDQRGSCNIKTKKRPPAPSQPYCPALTTQIRRFQIPGSP